MGNGIFGEVATDRHRKQVLYVSRSFTSSGGQGEAVHAAFFQKGPRDNLSNILIRQRRRRVMSPHPERLVLESSY
jgi:hypothetical protein